MGCHISREVSLADKNHSNGVNVSSFVGDVIECDAMSNSSMRKRTTDTKYFTEEQKRLIRESWTVMKPEEEDIGKMLFLELFERQPRIKQLFNFRDLEGDQLVSHVMFRVHSMRFMRAIDSTVKQMDALDVSVGNMLYHLGQKHQWIDDFLEADYLPAFLDAVSKVFREHLQRTCQSSGMEMDVEAALAAWGEVFDFIVSRMKDGYRDVAGKSKKKPPRRGQRSAKSTSSVEPESYSDF